MRACSAISTAGRCWFHLGLGLSSKFLREDLYKWSVQIFYSPVSWRVIWGCHDYYTWLRAQLVLKDWETISGKLSVLKLFGFTKAGDWFRSYEALLIHCFIFSNNTCHAPPCRVVDGVDDKTLALFNLRHGSLTSRAQFSKWHKDIIKNYWFGGLRGAAFFSKFKQPSKKLLMLRQSCD